MYPARFVEFFAPCMWKTLHSVAYTYPDNPTLETRKDYIDFFTIVGKVIPCPSCSDHYQEYVKDHPIDADNREALAKWIYDLHDFVNKRKGVKSPSFKEVTNMYTGFTKADHDRLNSMPETKKLKKLADPHFGRKPTPSGGQAEQASGGVSQALKMFLIFASVIIALFLFSKLRERMDKTRESRKREALELEEK